MIKLMLALLLCFNTSANAGGNFFRSSPPPEPERTEVFVDPKQSIPPKYSKVIKASKAYLQITAKGQGESLVNRANAIHRFSINLKDVSKRFKADLKTLSLDYVVDKELKDGFFTSSKGLPYSLPSQIKFKLSVNLADYNNDLFMACFKLNEIIQTAGAGLHLQLKLTAIKTEYDMSREDLRRELIALGMDDIKAWYKKLDTDKQLEITGLDSKVDFVKLSPTSYRAYVLLGYRLTKSATQVIGPVK